MKREIQPGAGEEKTPITEFLQYKTKFFLSKTISKI